VQQALRPFELTVPEYLVLASLVRLTARHGVAQSQRELSDDSGVDPMTTSRVMRALDARHLVDRNAQYDARCWGVIATGKGKRLAGRARGPFEAASASFLAPLGAQRQRFGKLLRKLD